MSKVQFVTTISKMGPKLVIGVPKDYYDELNIFTDTKQVRVTIDDEWRDGDK